MQSGTFLLGIIAETRYAPIVTPAIETLSFAGLGLAFDAEIIETIGYYLVMHLVIHLVGRSSRGSHYLYLT